MILRRITEHVKAQNWTAVALDFVIVVVGVFIGIQVSNWNEARGAREQELAVLGQLSIEYAEIASAVERQILIREGYVESLAAVIAGLEEQTPMPEPIMIKRALIAARSTGRPPAKSAAYLQLTASGRLAQLSNDRLKNRLVQYHTLLEREAFVFSELSRTAAQEFFANEAVDFDINGLAFSGAAIDAQTYSPETNTAAIRDYDVAALRDRVGQYEWQHMVNKSMVRIDKFQLGLAHEILADIEAELAQ